jgi:putative SbcD/Mre11-related phosphoesterase
MEVTIQPIPHEPALYIKKHEMLVVADLHIGIEQELQEKGLHTPSQLPALLAHLISLIEKSKAKEIILLGDIKHTIPASTSQERKDIRHFFTTIQQYGVIHVIPGNHDGFIQRSVTSEVHIHSTGGMTRDTIGFTHGHRWPPLEVMQCNQIVLGHTHPTIMLTDRLGYRSYEPCWLRGKLTLDAVQSRYPEVTTNPSFIMMPAFNPLCGGIAINKESPVGPFTKLIDFDNTQVYLLDGSLLGPPHSIS